MDTTLRALAAGYVPAAAYRDLAATASAARAERDAALTEVARLRAIIEGRTIPPTPAEIEAHEETGGRWRCITMVSRRRDADRMVGRVALAHIAELDAAGFTSVRWWATDFDGRLCPWPTAPTPDAPRYTTTSAPGAAIVVEEHRLDAAELRALDFGRNPFPRGDQ